jgi:hypothetical protein
MVSWWCLISRPTLEDHNRRIIENSSHLMATAWATSVLWSSQYLQTTTNCLKRWNRQVTAIYLHSSRGAWVMKTTLNNSHRELLVLKIRRDSSIHKSLPRDHYSRYRKLCNKEGYWKATRRLLPSHKTLLDRLCRDPKHPLVPRLLFKQVKSNLRRNKTQTQRIYHI